MISQKSSLIVGIAGGSGSGKTTLANSIIQRLGTEFIDYLPYDAYYRDLSNLSADQRDRINFDHPDSLETELLVRHIHQLISGESIDLPIYDFATHLRNKNSIQIQPKPIILVDGILIFYKPDLRGIFDLKLFVDSDADIRFIRRLQRDICERGRSIDSVIHQYLTTVRPMHEKFVEPTKQYADIIIPGGGMNAEALDLVIKRIRDLLSSSVKSSYCEYIKMY
jgi:uridine kinase